VVVLLGMKLKKVEIFGMIQQAVNLGYLKKNMEIKAKELIVL
jgi:hypothetical protein